MFKTFFVFVLLSTICFGQTFRFKLIGSCLLEPDTWLDCYDIIVLDTIAFLANEDLTVINIARPDSPFVITHTDTTHAFRNGVALLPPHLYAMGIGGLASFDISNLQAPMFLDSIDMPLQNDILLYNNYLFCTTSDYLHLFDASVPESLQYLGIIDSSHFAGRLINNNDFLFEPIGACSLLVFDVGDPANPQKISSLVLPNAVGLSESEPFFKDSLIYLSYLPLGGQYSLALLTINVADPMNPFLVAESPDVGERVNGSYDLTLSGNYAYATIGSQMERSSRKPGEQYEQPENVAVFDVSDPTSPFPVWLYEVPVANYRAIDSRADTIYLCNGEYFYIFVDTLWTGLSETEQVRRMSDILQCHPNPCNHKLTIKHSLGQYRDYARSIAIYDISGRLLYSAPISKNEESGVVIWDCKSLTGKRVPTGVYFVALRCKESNLVVKKIIITN